MEQFLNDLFGDAVGDDARLTVFAAPSRRWRRFARIDNAARHAARLSGTQDVYFGVGLVGGEPRGRGGAEDVNVIGALWADVDVAGHAHPGKPLPASTGEAQALLDNMPLRPSIV